MSFLLTACVLLFFCLNQNESKVFEGKSKTVETQSFFGDNALIVNGFNAPVGRPFFAVVSFSQMQSQCGATIIAPFWVITSAHCVFAVPGKQEGVD